MSTKRGKVNYSCVTLVMMVLLKLLHPSTGYLYPSKISTGIYEEDVSDSTIFYDSFMTMLFEYKVPSWRSIDITLRDWRSICQTDEFSPSYTCPVFFYLERFIERMQSELVTQSSIVTGFGQAPLSNVLPNMTERCTRIQKHFPTMLTSKLAIDNYVNTLTSTPSSSSSTSSVDCHLQGHFVQRAIMNYVYNIKTIYSSMVRKFESEFSTKTGGTVADRIGPAYYVNQITAAQGLMLFNYFFEKNRWDSAVKSCAMSLIPTSVLKSSNLTSALNKIEEEARKQKYSLSIPPTDTSSYLVTPLADCTFIPNSVVSTPTGTATTTQSATVDSFVTRVLVPVLRNSFSPKLVKLTSVPFLLDTKSKVDKSGPSVCQILDNLSGTYVFEEISGFLMESKCENEMGKNLCQVPTTDETMSSSSSSSMWRRRPSLCAAAYFSRSRSWTTLKKYCRLTCDSVVDDLTPLPIFTRVNSNTFVVTGNSNLEVVIKCTGRRDQIVNPDELGSIQVTLPCTCGLNFRSKIFLPEQPCSANGDDLTIHHITPVQFFSHEFLNNFDLDLGNFTGILNRTMMDPILFDTVHMAKSKRIAGQVDIETGFSALGRPNDDSGDNEIDIMAGSFDSLQGIDEDANQQQQQQDGGQPSSSSSPVVVLWIFVILQLIAFTVFVLFVLYKFGIFSSYNRFYAKDPRLSYSISTSQQTQRQMEANAHLSASTQNIMDNNSSRIHFQDDQLCHL